MSLFDNIDPEQLTLFTSFLAIAISEGRDTDELEVLGQFFSTLGDSVSLFAVQKEKILARQEERNKADNQSSNQDD